MSRKFNRVHHKITEALRVVKENGYTVRPGRTLDESTKSCCPLGAVYLLMDQKERERIRIKNFGIMAVSVAGYSLNMLDTEIAQFIQGFDNERDNTSWQILGKAFRMEMEEEIDE